MYLLYLITYLLNIDIDIAIFRRYRISYRNRLRDIEPSLLLMDYDGRCLQSSGCGGMAFRRGLF